MTDQLIIFAKNPVKGKVKTRLAQDIGEDDAMRVYIKLLKHTATVCKSSTAVRHVYYSDAIERNDLWDQDMFNKSVQKGDDLGARMSSAIGDLVSKGPCVLIGTDCPTLHENDINEAFSALKYCDVVIGPAEDGGYYLIGMKEHKKELFENVRWSTDVVLDQTFDKIKKNKWSVKMLRTQIDIDTAKDL